MQRLQDIGGAQALLSLGSKDSKSDDANQTDNTHSMIHEQQLEEDKGQNEHAEPDLSPNADYQRNDPDSLEDKANQQLNDAVEAAVMRYVGSTLGASDPSEHDRQDTENHHEGNGTHESNSNGDNNKRRLNHDEIMSHIGDYQWDSFLAENVAPELEGPSPKRSRRRRSYVNNGDLDPELADLGDEPSEHDQLVHAAIMGAGELAKQLSFPHSNMNQHNLQKPDNESAAINQLAQAASTLSAKGRPKTTLKKKRTFRKPATQNVASLNPQNSRDKLDAMSLEAFVEQCASEALLWLHSQSNISLTGPRPFSPVEMAIMDNFVEGYCRINNLSRLDVCRRVWATERTKDNFWECMTKVLPYRSRASVYKHVRRQYHVFDIRAKWTTEEDELLKRLVESCERNWKKIGEVMNRMPEDCRDRWRNYVKCGENRAMNKWSEEEERTLKNIVLEMITNEEEDKPINWTLVSEKMNGVRSRIQCRYKWNKLLRREAVTRIELMDNDTKIWLINSLLEANFPNAESIDWEYILHLYHEWNKEAKTKDFLWTTTDFKVTFEKLRFTVRDHKSMALHTVLSKILLALYNDTGSDRNELARAPQLAKRKKPQDVEQHAKSIANAAVAAVSTGVNDHDAQQQEYSLWR